MLFYLPPLSRSSFSLGSLLKSEGCDVTEEVTYLGESWTIVAGLVSKIMVLSLMETVYLFALETKSEFESCEADATLSPVDVATDRPLTSLRSPFTSPL